MNEAVMNKAKELAQLIAQSPEYITMRATEDAANQDEELVKLFERYNAVRSDVEKETMEKEPSFDRIGDLSRDLDAVQQEIKQQPMYQALQSARRSFSQMMNGVNTELSNVLNPGGQGSGCSGNCSACGGCG